MLRRLTPTETDAEAAKVCEFAAVFSAIGNPVRLAALIRIAQREWSVGELAQDLGISHSLISQHLSKLRQLQLTTVRREGQTVYYSCSDPYLLQLLSQSDLLP